MMNCRGIGACFSERLFFFVINERPLSSLIILPVFGMFFRSRDQTPLRRYDKCQHPVCVISQQKVISLPPVITIWYLCRMRANTMDCISPLLFGRFSNTLIWSHALIVLDKCAYRYLVHRMRNKYTRLRPQLFCIDGCYKFAYRWFAVLFATRCFGLVEGGSSSSSAVHGRWLCCSCCLRNKGAWFPD